MQKNLCVFERVIRLLFAALALFAVYALYEGIVARTIAGLFGLYALGEGLLGVCPLQRHLGVNRPTERLSSTAVSFITVMGIQVLLGYEWWMGAWEKWASADYVSSMPVTLAYFASKNPFVWFAKFLTGFATTHAELFASLVRSGETLVALGLFLTAIAGLYARRGKTRRSTIIVVVAALLGGLFMNTAFYFASAWTSPGTHALNVVMFWSQALLLYFWLCQWRAVKN